MKAKYWALICLFVYSICLFCMYVFKPTAWFWLFLAVQASSVVVAYLVIRTYSAQERIPKLRSIFCPVCGYYCLGKGGIDCIDKPSIIKQAIAKREEDR